MAGEVIRGNDLNVATVKKVNSEKISPKIIAGALVAVFFAVAFYFRAVLPYNQVFVGDWIKFTSNDAYYFMRLVDNWIYNFPTHTAFDPYFIYPGGNGVVGMHFFDGLLAFITWIIGLGHPTERTIDVVGVYYPAVLGALTVVPVYFIGKALFNRWAGVLAAGLLSVLSGEFLGRSILGFTDQHVAETLFSATAALFVILAVKEAGQRQLTFNHFIQRNWRAIIKPVIFSVLAGIFLGIYLITWQGALLFVFIISLYFIIQFIIDHLKGKPTDHLGVISFILFLVALVIFLPFVTVRVFSYSIKLAVIIPVVLSVVSRLLSARGLKPFYYPLILVGIGIISIAIFYVIDPDTFKAMLSNFNIFTPSGATATTTLEMQPFLSPQGSFSTLVAWGNFSTNFFLFKSWPVPGFGLIAFVILIWLSIKKRADDKALLFFLLWTLIILIATLSQRRFAYYLAVNIAVLSGYLSWQAIWLSGLRKLVRKPEEVKMKAHEKPGKSRVKKQSAEKRGISIYHINTGLAVIVVFFFVFYFNINGAKTVASQASFAPTDAWEESMHWLKQNTPEPMGSPEAYYQLDKVPYGVPYDYPSTAYGVTSWWDYGYWISRTAHRIPSANPSQASAPITRIAKLFLADDEAATYAMMKELGSSYIILDFSTCTSKFWAVNTWAGKNPSEFIGTYYVAQEGKLVPVQLFHPEYYRTLCVRLYNFNGKAVTAKNPTVITLEKKVDRDGFSFEQITDIKQFPSYQEALDFVAKEGAANHRIVGLNPFVSPVPVEAVQNYKLVYSSKSGISNKDVGLVPEVKVFEYLGK
jgi:dolichyl-diphosphooligosaccharide--protein glycosyltransferase